MENNFAGEMKVKKVREYATDLMKAGCLVGDFRNMLAEGQLDKPLDSLPVSKAVELMRWLNTAEEILLWCRNTLIKYDKGEGKEEKGNPALTPMENKDG